MLRNEAAMAIALINKNSKLIANAVQTGDTAMLTRVLSEGVEYEGLGGMVTEYLEIDKDPKLYGPLLHLVNVDSILDFTYKNKEYQYGPQMIELATVVENLRQIAAGLEADTHRNYPNLTKFFSNEKANELFHRAYRAGILTEDYQPKKGVQMYQLKLVAYAIIQILNLPTRDRWCRFNEQWNLHEGRLSRIFIPMTKGNNIYRIIQLYPEADFHELLSPQHNQEVPFKTNLTKKQAASLFNGLQLYGFLDANTEIENFEAMLGVIRMPSSAINWTGSYYSLVYFAKLVLMESNPKVWLMVEDWFTVDNKKLNHGTLKSKSTFLNRNKDNYEFTEVLDDIVRTSIGELE